MNPFTNSILDSSFERNIKKVFPGLSELHFQQSVLTSSRLGSATTTNIQVVIQITATGKSGAQAIRNANAITPTFCQAVEQMFTNASVTILNPAVGASQGRQVNRAANLFFNKQVKLSPTKIAGAVAFVNSGLRLTPNPEWEQHYSPTPNPPSLIRRGKDGDQFLAACVVGNKYSDLLSTRAKQTFTTDSGLVVVKASRSQTGRSPSQRTDYFVTNGVGQVIQITHIAISGNQTEEVHDMLLQSLQLNPP